MKKKPLSILIISLIYVLEPIGNLFQAAFINDLSIFGEYGILSRLLWTDWVILLLFPVVAYGIYRVRKWGWYLFISFSALLIFYNFFVYYFLNPSYNLETILLFILTITFMSALFLRKHVYAPYFNPRLRWWETAARYRVILDSRIVMNNGSVDCKTLDISETGCFLRCGAEFTEGNLIWVKINCLGLEINCLGKVVRKAGAEENQIGYGIMFRAMPKETKRKLRNLICALQRLNYEERKEKVPLSEIPKDYYLQRYGFLNQLGFRIRSAFKHSLQSN